MKKTLFLLSLLMVAIQPMAAEDLYSRLPSNRGGWMNLSYGVTDSTYYTRYAAS